MKSFIQAIAIAATLAIPAMSFAQSDQPVTRAEVRAELVQLEKAGYDPASDQTQYPKNIQAAQARVVSEKNAGNAYGGVANDTSSSGHALRWGAKGNDIAGFPPTPDFQRP
jgi:Domain of unknown function (DUF4148)